MIDDKEIIEYLEKMIEKTKILLDQSEGLKNYYRGQENGLKIALVAIQTAERIAQ